MTNAFLAGDERLVLEMNPFKLQPPFTHTATYVATSDFQTELFSKLVLTGTHLRKRVIDIIFYTIEFSAGLNSLQVDKVGRQNDKQTSPYTPTSLYCMYSVVQVWPDFTCHTHTIIV